MAPPPCDTPNTNRYFATSILLWFLRRREFPRFPLTSPASARFLTDVCGDRYRYIQQLEEDDTPWEFDSLLQSVTQEFNAEKRSAFHAKIGTDHDDGSTANTFERRSSSQEQGGSRRSSRALVA